MGILAQWWKEGRGKRMELERMEWGDEEEDKVEMGKKVDGARCYPPIEG